LSLDLADEHALRRALADFELLVSCVREPRLTPERVAIRSGGTILSVASLTLRDRLALRRLSGARGRAIVHAGVNPGLCTILAADLLADYPQADGLEIVLTLSANGSGGAHGLETVAIPLLKRRRRHLTATVEAPPPYGKRRCMAVGDGSEGFFGEVGSDLRRRVYWMFQERSTHQLLLLLNAAGALRLLPDALLLMGHRRAPATLSQEPKRDVVAVTLGGRRLAAEVVEGAGDYAMTATVAAAFAELASARRDSWSEMCGCLGAETVFDRAELSERLAGQGVRIRRLEGR
jgi:hypothetical protein